MSDSSLAQQQPLPRFKIGELSRLTMVHPRSLRYYEEQGLLVATRTPGGHREYDQRSVDRVIRIQELYAAGLCSAKIAELLPCMRDTDGGPGLPPHRGWRRNCSPRANGSAPPWPTSPAISRSLTTSSRAPSQATQTRKRPPP